MTGTALPRLALLATGGTIAARAADATVLTEYQVTEPVQAILAAVPALGAVADVTPEQLFNVDSRAITGRMLLRLASRANRLLARSDVDGIVITHGTDTLEETACFLDLTLPRGKPVALVGAMRPASAPSADGPLNLFQACRTAADPDAGGRGVMVVLNDTIHAARSVAKMHTTAVQAFDSPGAGALGRLDDAGVHFERPAAGSPAPPVFAVHARSRLPDVDVLMDHQDASEHLFRASIDAGRRGIVIAGCGNGGLTPRTERGVKMAVSQGLICVRATRVATGAVSPGSDDARLGTVCAGSLNPQKARILLSLALAAGADRATIQAHFDAYGKAY